MISRENYSQQLIQYPIAEVAKHEVATHQADYLYVSADVSAHLPNTHTGQDHLTLQIE